MSKKWLIISWEHSDVLDACYGRLIDECEGTYEEAAEHARQYVLLHSPVGVVGVIE